MHRRRKLEKVVAEHRIQQGLIFACHAFTFLIAR